MTNDSKDNDDIIIGADDQPETLVDEQLDNVDGGLKYQLKDVMVTSYGVSGANMTTIVGASATDMLSGGGNDTIEGSVAIKGLRKRPGR